MSTLLKKHCTSASYVIQAHNTKNFHFVTALLAEKIATGSKSYTTLDLFQITLLTKSFTKDQVNNQPIAALIKGQHFRQQIIRNS